MGRNVNKKTVDIWADELLAVIHKSKADLETFWKLKLENINLTNYENQINTCYRDINKVNHMGRAGVSKVLHIFAPEFFPTLDSNIAKLLNDNCDLKIWNSAKGYYSYMLAIQHFLKSNLKTCSSLAKKYNKKTKLRIVDNYLWMISPNRADP